jgi:hypothetical protein
LRVCFRPLALSLASRENQHLLLLELSIAQGPVLTKMNESLELPMKSTDLRVHESLEVDLALVTEHIGDRHLKSNLEWLSEPGDRLT